MGRRNPTSAQESRDLLAEKYDLEAKNKETLAELGDRDVARGPNGKGKPGDYMRLGAKIARKRAAAARRKVS